MELLLSDQSMVARNGDKEFDEDVARAAFCNDTLSESGKRLFLLVISSSVYRRSSRKPMKSS